MLYQLYEFNRAIVAPLRAAADLTQHLLSSPFNPLAYTPTGRHMAAASELFESVTRRYGKPNFGIGETSVRGASVRVREEIVWWDTFCDVRHFKRHEGAMKALGVQKPDPKVLMVAPMSGHYATLLRGTVEAMLPDHEVYITDWRDAAQVPVAAGRFDLGDFIDYIIRILQFLGPDTNVMAVCQPGPAVLAAVSLMAEDEDPATPASMIFMGSPIDTRKSPTEPNILAESRPYTWFEHLIHTVPYPHPGFMRRVYPGFIQLTGFIAMNRDRHVDAHFRFFENLVKGDGDSAQKHREFYDEYLSVMDLTAEFYLQTIDKIFQRHLLPRGEFHHRGRKVRPEMITETALMTVEGENDDISGIGQTQAAHDLCINLPAAKQFDYIQPTVGHYGVFNGSRFRREILPRIKAFIREHRRA